jgi:hypothetical protein
MLQLFLSLRGLLYQLLPQIDASDSTRCNHPFRYRLFVFLVKGGFRTNCYLAYPGMASVVVLNKQDVVPAP